MIQVKEFLDTNSVTAESKANAFLATLDEKQVIDVKYSTGRKTMRDGEEQRSYILVVYKTSAKSVNQH